MYMSLLAGIFSANSAVILSAIGEVTDSTNQIVAFPIFGLCWPLGSIIGSVQIFIPSFASSCIWQPSHRWYVCKTRGALSGAV